MFDKCNLQNKSKNFLIQNDIIVSYLHNCMVAIETLNINNICNIILLITTKYQIKQTLQLKFCHKGM